MNLKYEINPENLKILEIKQIALDKDKFGVLTFDKAYPQLHELRKIIVEFEELGYKELLTPDEVRQVDKYRDRLLQYIRRIHEIDPATDTSFNKTVRDNLENEIDRFYNDTAKQLRGNHVFLRQEAARKSSDGEELAEQQKAAAQAEQKYKELSKKIEEQLQALDEKKRSIEKTSGEIAATTFGKHFEAQAKEHAKKVAPWETRRELFFKWILGIIVANFILYLALFITNKLNSTILAPADFFTLEYGVVKIALLAILFYGLSFASKNYRINSNLEVINKHRKNVAETLKHFLDTEMGNEDRSHIVR